jgi:tetratricopeptide (TPR) repeat protein
VVWPGRTTGPVKRKGQDRAGGRDLTAAKDFFISYTSADVAWAEWIAQTLEGAGHTTVLQAWDFRPGDNFIQRMDQALGEAERVLAVLSPAYFASEYARDEWTAALVRARGERDRLLPVRIAPCQLPPLLANRVYLDLVGLEEPAAATRLLAGVASDRAKPTDRRPYPGGHAEPGGVSFPGQQPAIFEVPPRNPHFIGRGALLQALREQLGETKVGAVVQAGTLSGLGGVGKSQLVVEYAHRYASDYDLVWWIPAEEPATISGRLAQLGRRLGLAELPSLEEQVGMVFDTLGQRDRWLLIYDNAQQPADLNGRRPPAGGGQVLVTSRNPAWGGIGATVRVNVLARKEAVAFLQLRTGASDQAALERLAAALGDLPLALEQAAAYLEETGTTAREYLELLHEHEPQLLALGRPVNSEQTIATTWTVSLERLKTEAPAAEDLLCLCAFLAPDDVPHALLVDYAERLPERLARVVGDRLGFRQVLGALHRYSLVTVTTDALSVHRLVQAVVRHALPPEQATKWAAAALRLVWLGFPGFLAKDVGAWPIGARLLPHALAATDQAEKLGAETTGTGSYLREITPKLLLDVGGYLRHRGEYAKARKVHEHVLAVQEARLGKWSSETAVCLNQLALDLYSLGDLNGARRLLERAVTIYGGDPDDFAAPVLNNPAVARYRVDPDDRAKTPVLNNLAVVLEEQGDWAGARRLHERVLAIREARLSADHPDIAQSLNNLASVLASQGDMDGARRLFERALAIWETRGGANHPETARSLSNLATVLRDQGDLDRARLLEERALSIRKVRLGEDHPDTAWSLQNLARIRHGQGDLDGARRFHERALAIREARLGPDHPDTAWSQRDLAALMAELEDVE